MTDRGEHLPYGTQGPRFHGSPPAVDVDDDFDNAIGRPLGSQIVSPRHWDCRQLTQKAGHSPLDTAALGCQEYHGYGRGYLLLTTGIIFRCGYCNPMGAGVITCFDDIILMPQIVLDTWVNPRTMQSGPYIDRILDKGLVVLPKLASMDVVAAVEFYDQLQKTLALFLLPLVLFDAVNFHMRFKGLCPPGLGLPRYAEIVGEMMEVIPCLLLTYDSQVMLLVTVVCTESNNAYDLLWRVMELLVPGFNPTLQISAPVWMGEGIFDFCISYVFYFCLQVKKGLLHDNCTKRIKFLQAVHDPAYIDVITTSQAHIDTFSLMDQSPHLLIY